MFYRAKRVSEKYVTKKSDFFKNTRKRNLQNMPASNKTQSFTVRVGA